MRRMASAKAAGSPSSGVMSLKRMPGFGKSGTSRMYFARSMKTILSPRPFGKGYDSPLPETTMPLLIRTATPDDLAVIAEFNRRLGAETEGKALDLPLLLAGVRALLADPAKGRYFVADEGG